MAHKSHTMLSTNIDSPADIKHPVIHSLDASLYIVHATYRGLPVTLGDSKGSASFRSLGAAIGVLSELGLTRALLRHVSAYDEMVGQPVGYGNVLEQVVDVATVRL